MTTHLRLIRGSADGGKSGPASRDELDRVLECLGESIMNVIWNGDPVDPYMRQLVHDGEEAVHLLVRVRDHGVV